MHDFDQLAAVLRLLSSAQAQERAFDLRAAATRLGAAAHVVRERCDLLERWGLVLTGIDEPDEAPLVLNSGRQFLASSGGVGREVLRFLPLVVDDLNTRAALIHAGAAIVDDFRSALIAGAVTEHARSMVPEAFAAAITEPIAVNLFAAAVALMARLSDGEPAACVGEEIVAVRLMDGARAWIAAQAARGALSAKDARHATHEVRALFEFLRDDDVLDLFAMREPADAAIAAHSARNREMGIADRRLEAWFRPFDWTIPTGYLHS